MTEIAPTSSASTVMAIERAADVLSLFTEPGVDTLGVTEIARALNLSKAVVYRVLTSFRLKGYIEIDTKTRRYRLGPGSLRLGMAYLNRTDVRTLARPAMEHLSRAINETATLSLRTGWTRTYIDQVTPNRDVKMVVTLGQQAPLHAGSSSKAFLAFLSADEQEEYLGETLEPLTAKTPTDPDVLRKEIADIRDRGFSSSLGERLEGAASVAAPILGHDGRPVAVMSVCGPLERFRDEADEAARLLVEQTQALSRQFGYDA
ncbi:MAG TPA: IclR family transcriptional regulator [Actinomycetota bacterium]